MKKYKHSKKLFVIAITILVLCTGIFAIWQYFIPRYVVAEVLGKFENACYAGNSDKMLELIYSKFPYYKLMQESPSARGINELTNLFNKFEKGFRVIKIRHGFGSLPREGLLRREIILVHLVKNAKKDGKERSMESELAKIDGEWKIMYYYFQDYVDY
jgi:hypothetical protein